MGDRLTVHPPSAAPPRGRDGSIHAGSLASPEPSSPMTAALDEGSSTSSSVCHGNPPQNQPLLTADDPICLVGEVVGGYRLPIHDPHNEYYAYVLIRYEEDFCHVTKAALEPGRNPLWTVSTGSLFFLETTSRELASKTLHCFVWYKRKDPLRLATLERLLVGHLSIQGATTILEHLQEQPIDLPVAPPHHGDDNPMQQAPTTATTAASSTPQHWHGTLTLRFRLATRNDQEFVEAFQDARRRSNHQQPPSESLRLALLHDPRPYAPLVTETNESKMARVTFVNALSNAFSARNVYQQGEHRIRVKPHPDKDHVEDTMYMSPKRIKELVLAPSKQWVPAGSGSFAKVYLEILSCHDLPNADVGEAMGNLTDCFVCAVFEDAMVQTPVIDDELSPHWLPWTQRAFVFGCQHPASILYLGAFDYELGLSKHEPLGRVGVNISNLQRDTDYVLTYPMYNTSHVTDRKPAGSIRIRLRIEYADERQAMLAALRPRPKFHVNVFKEKSLNVVRYTCFGEYGDDNNGEKFDLTVLRSYVNEILEHKDALMYCISDALVSLVFWRGQVRVGNNIRLPLHSFLLFWSAVFLVEHPHMAPSFFLLSVAWILLASNTLRRQHPSPWHRCPSFWHYVDILRNGQSSLSIEKIEPNEGETETAAYDAAWAQRLHVDQKFAATKAQLIQEMSDFGNENIHTTQSDLIPLDLLERLASYQGRLGQYCKYLRFIKSIATWEESIISFWIACIFLVTGLISLLFPWAFILRWSGRILVWGFLGPHMKIVDALLHSNHSTDEQVLADLIDSYRKESRLARQRRQVAVKLKDIKQTLFGKYSTLIPSYNLSRHYDRPLPRSFANLRAGSTVDAPKLADTVIPGQQCYGDIIPRPHFAALQHDMDEPVLEKMLELVQGHVRNLLESDCNQSPEDVSDLVIKQESSLECIGTVAVVCERPAETRAVALHGSTFGGIGSSKGTPIRRGSLAFTNRRGSMTAGDRNLSALREFLSDDGRETSQGTATTEAESDRFTESERSESHQIDKAVDPGGDTETLVTYLPDEDAHDDVEIMLCSSSNDDVEILDDQQYKSLLYFRPDKLKEE